MKDFQNSKGKYESRKILDFATKNKKNWFFEIFEFLLLFILCFSYFEVFIYFRIFESFLVFESFFFDFFI
jgi:hypothetical protein